MALHVDLVARLELVLSVADFALGSTLFARDAAGIDLGPTPNVSAWIARLEALPSWRRAIDDMPL